MPENPNIDPETGSEFIIENYITMATNVSNVNSHGSNNSNNNNNNRKSAVPRIPSAGLKYYDIATQLLGKAGSDIEELFIAAARDGVYERLENFLHRNRSDALVSIDVKDKTTGNTPLIWAAKRGHPKIVQLLLRHGADITLRNYTGHTAVEVASPSIRNILLESVERQTEANHLLLLQAAWQGDIKVVARLLTQKKVIDVNCKNADGFTPVMLATRDIQLFEKLSTQMSRPFNPVEVVAELLASRADIHATDSDGKTCLHHACQSKAHIAHSVVSQVISGGSELEKKDKRCFTPIHCASLTGNAECITTLLGGGSLVNSRGFAGATPLHITSYNNHERATAVLLQHGADVSIQDDRGLTALDLARSRKMKKKLQEAWSDVVNSRSTTSLGPIRAHSREDLRTSIEDLTGKRKKGGEVIFDGMPANPFADASKKDCSTTIATPRHSSSLRRTSSLRDLGSVRIDMLLDTWSPLSSLTRTGKGNRGITRHLSLKEKTQKTEELENGSQLLSQFPKDGPRRLGQVRSKKPSPLPRTKSRSTERLPAISPDRMSIPDRNLESPVQFNRASRVRRSFEDKKLNGRGRRITPISTREGTTVGDEMPSGAPSPTPSVRHRRSDSDPNRGTPNLLDIAVSCDPYLQMQRRGRSYSMSSNFPPEGPDSNRQTPLQRENTVTSVQREATLMSVCSVRSDSRMSTNSNHSPRLLNLGQMLSNSRTPVQNAPLYGPSSSKVIPPTPTFITQRSISRLDKHSESDISPRSDEDVDIYKGILENPAELIRSHTMFKEEFVLEESRPKEPYSQSSSVTPTDSSGSSGRSSHMSSPREANIPQTTKYNKSPRKSDKVTGNVKKESGSKKDQFAGTVSVTKYKLNEKPTAPDRTGNVSEKGGNTNSVNKKSDNTNVPNNNVKNKNVSVLQATAMQNAAVINANKTAESNPSVKAGGTILVHSDIGKLSGKKSDENTGASDPAKTEGHNSDNTVQDTKTEKTKSNKVQAIVTNTTNNNQSGRNKVFSKDNKTVSSSTVKTFQSKNKQSTLQVVPTKLTENIIQNSTKEPKTNEQDANSKLGSDNDDKENANVTKNTNASAQSTGNGNVVKTADQKTAGKVGVQGNSAKTPTINQGQEIKVGDKTTADVQNKAGQTAPQTGNKCVQPSNKGDSGNKTVSVIQSGNKTVKSINQSYSNRMVQQAASAQLSNRQGAQSRNSSVNKTKSAGTVPRPTLTIKKDNTVPTASKTPRLASSLQKSLSSDKVNVSTSSVSAQETSSGAKTNGEAADTKTTKSSSPTDLVPASVCRTASMSKSYNMSGVLTTAKTAGITSDTTTVNTGSKPTLTRSDSTANEKRSSEVSKSSNDVLTGSAKMVNTSTIVSKSISKMPSVGSVPKQPQNPNSSKGFLRSSSMSTIEESKDKSSTSDMKSSSTGTTKKRPASDGPAGMTSGQENPGPVSKSNAPLIDILPNKGTTAKVQSKGFVTTPSKLTTPVIVNPFEELEQKREEENMLNLGKNLTASEFGFVVERSKTQSSLKSKNGKTSRKSRDKPTSASSRVSSGRRRRARSKDSSANKSDGESSRPRSGKNTKRCKSAKRKRKIPEGSLAKANEKPDVALIGGIGWHLQTSCIDKTDVDAVIVSQFDSSESESEDVNLSPPRLDIPEPQYFQTNKLLESPSLASPRFKEVRPDNDVQRDDLPRAVDDGYPPMNLDMTQASLSSKQNENRAGVFIEQDLPDDINAFLSKIHEQESQEFDDIDDYDDESDYDYDDDITNAIHRDIMMGKLTPIPESPAQTHTGTPSTLQHVARTVKAISNFDANIKEDDLNALLGSTPRLTDPNSVKNLQKTSSSSDTKGKSGSFSANSGRSQTKRDAKQGSAGSKPGSSTSNVSKVSPVSAVSRGSKSSQGVRSANTDRSVGASFKQPSASSTRASASSTRASARSKDAEPTGSAVKNSPRERCTSRSGVKYEVHEPEQMGEVKVKPSETPPGEIPGSNLKSLLAEKMQGIQRLLEKSNSASRARVARRKSSQNSDVTDRESTKGGKTPTNDDIEERLGNVNDDIVIDLTNRGLDSERTDDDIKSTSRSSRKERKFSETKTTIPDDDMKDAIDEIFSNTFPSARSNQRSLNNSLNSSLRSRNNTLTEADRNVLAQMAKDNYASPFHARESTSNVRISSSYDESGTLNKDNPELMRKFNPDNFHLGQKVKAMIDAGADSTKVKQMMKSDNEAKQLAKIMNSFRQMELYAGPGTNNKSSSKKETPRREAEVARSYSHHTKSSSVQKGMVPRPGSAGAGKIRTGKFTEIKEKMSSSSISDKPRSAVPKKLAEEFERSPFKQVGSSSIMDQDLRRAITADSSDSDEDERINLLDDTLESRPDSACTTLSSQSSITEETIQWKKGNVLGKGAFGTVWCGLTSEGQLIAVKQIELNTNNHHKAKKEYEKVQEEVELLKTLEHKNIVGYLGTSLEDSIVSIFMQFVPGGSIASILARFGALDEAVFRKYTKQILEGVEYLHENDVIHRDIKGGNVMLMPNGVIKLIDFGCAKRLCINLSMGQSEILKSMKGTPYWMAPEVVNETGHGKKSDIWSIGCTVFEMATRKPPWAEMNPMAAIFAIGSNKSVPQLPDRFTDEAREFVNCCLTKDQTRRLAASDLLQLPFIRRKNRKLSSNC